MRPLRSAAGVALLAALGCFLLPAQQDDVILRAMKDEIERSKQLKIVSLDAPYFIEYWAEDESLFTCAASLGALLGCSQSERRAPMVHVRVGDYNFDNTDHIFSDAYGGSRYDPAQLPLDNNYLALRQVFWLATDRAYKTAEDAIARKRSSIKNVNLQDQLPDFSKMPPATSVLPVQRTPVNEAAWKDRVVKLSAIFDSYPQVLSSGVDMQDSQSTDYLVNSEGTVLRIPEDLSFVRVRAFGLAADGTQVHDAVVFQAFRFTGLPAEAEMRQGITEVAKNVTAMAAAPIGDAYSGPVLFEPHAAAQLFGQVLADNLKLTRKPVSDPGRPSPYRPSELENRIGSRILPEWMDVMDDPTQTEWRGHTLLGHYLFDMEGVAPKPLSVVEKGVLKNFFLTRTPIIKGSGSNGHARMPGAFGAKETGFGNLFVRATQTMSGADIKKKLIELCRQRNKPYGMLVRKLDFPSSATPDEFRRMALTMAQSGATHPVSTPLLVYRVYPDGREELVRGIRFRGLSTRSLKDIIAASDDSYVFNFVDSNAPLALMGAGSFVTSSTVISPALLFDELEFERIQEDTPKPPVVPAPPLTSSGS
jgi:predicted Zn-dependent protease